MGEGNAHRLGLVAGKGAVFLVECSRRTAAGGRSTHHDHHVPPAALVELLHHGREVPKAVRVEGEVPPGVHVVQVVPLDVLQPQQGSAAGTWGPSWASPRPHRPAPRAPGPCVALTSGKWALVMFSTTWRVMAVDE